MTYWIDILNQALIFSIFAVSLNVLMGVGGQVSAAHAAFGAVGGYAAGYLSQTQGYGFGTCLIIGIVLATLVGLLVSLPAIGLAGEYLILLTLTVQTIVLVVISSVGSLGGEFGLTEIKAANIFGTDLLIPNDFLPWLALIAVVVWALCWAIGASGFGQTLRGIRDDELATAALGKNTYLYKVVPFALTAGLAGLAGALLVYYNGLAAPALFGFDVSMSIIVMIVLGGSGNLLGALVGTAFVIGSVGFFEKVISLNPDKASLVRLMAYGVALVVVLFLRPQGIVPEGAGASLRRRLRGQQAEPAVVTAGAPADAALPAAESDGDAGRVPEGTPAAAVAAAAPGGNGDPTRVTVAPTPEGAEAPAQREAMVELRGLEKVFGGVRAVHDLTF